MACVKKRRGKWTLDYRDQHGKRKWEATNLNKRDAQLLLAERLQSIGKGEFISKKDEKSFDDLVDAYKVAHIDVDLRKTTVKDYNGNIRLHILPYFTGWKLRAIDVQSIESFRSYMREKGTGIRTTNKCLTLLSMLYNYAHKNRWITFNPAVEVKKLKDEGVHREDLINQNIINPEEIKLLIDNADGRWKVMIMTAIFTGMRQGEILGFKWGDIDWLNGEILVRRTYTDGEFNEPKTKASRRRINMPMLLITALKEWQLECPSGELELVFPNGVGKPENHGNLLNRGFYPALRRAKVKKIRFHDLRHTYASLLIANKEEPKRIQTLMGHKSITTTYDIYGHLMPNGSDDLADRLTESIFGSRTVAINLNLKATEPQAIDYMAPRGFLTGNHSYKR